MPRILGPAPIRAVSDCPMQLCSSAPRRSRSRIAQAVPGDDDLAELGATVPLRKPFAGWIKSLWGCLVLASPFAMIWTLAILGLRLRRPRDRWRRLVRQPGQVAGLMAALVLAVCMVGFATMCVRVIGQPTLWIWTAKYSGGGGAWMGWPPGYLLFETDHFLDTMAMIGVAVAASWVLLLLSRQWRPERSWIDRAGRGLGWFWIAILPLTCWWDFHVRF